MWLWRVWLLSWVQALGFIQRVQGFPGTGRPGTPWELYPHHAETLKAEEPGLAGTRGGQPQAPPACPGGPSAGPGRWCGRLRGLHTLPAASQNLATESPAACAVGAQAGQAPRPAPLQPPARGRGGEAEGPRGGPRGAGSWLCLCLPLTCVQLSLTPVQELSGQWVPCGGLLEEEARLG